MYYKVGIAGSHSPLPQTPPIGEAPRTVVGKGEESESLHISLYVAPLPSSSAAAATTAEAASIQSGNWHVEQEERKKECTVRGEGLTAGLAGWLTCFIHR